MDPLPMMSVKNCTPSLLAAVGAIAIESSYLDRYIGSLIYGLAKLDGATGDVLLRRQMIGAKIELLGEIGHKRLQRRRAKQLEFARLMETVKTANTGRVDAIHGLWLPDVNIDPDDPTAILLGPTRAVRARGGKTRVSQTEEQANTLAREISKAHWSLQSFAAGTWPRLFSTRALLARYQLKLSDLKFNRRGQLAAANDSTETQ
jgi:hypothetical protein